MNLNRIRVAAYAMAIAATTGTVTAQTTTTATATPATAGTASGVIDATQTLPPNARPGQCWAKALIPAKYNEETINVLRAEGAEKIEIVPAEYKVSEQKVLIKDASFKLVPVPAVYETVEEAIEVAPAQSIWIRSPAEDAREASVSVINAAAAAGVTMETAQPGQCFVEHYAPPSYKTEKVRVLVKEASKKIEVIPANYETVEEKVLIKEASKKLVEVPAVFDTVTEKVLVQPATTEWKPGTGPIQRIDNTTGEIMCLVEIPAKYETIKKKVVKTQATTKVVEIPAEYETQKVRKLVTPSQEKVVEIPAEYSEVEKQTKISDARYGWFAKGDSSAFGEATGRMVCRKDIPPKMEVVKKRVLKTPATVKKVEVPAEYTTIEVSRIVTPPKENRIKIPEVKETMVKRVKVSDDRLEWVPVLCETNINRDIVRRIQNALKDAGFNPGPVDGALGQGTLRAAEKYQTAKGLPLGGLTMETIESLGVNL